MMMAIYFGNKDCIDALLSAGADPNLKDSEGNTALDWSMWLNYEGISLILREHGGVGARHNVSKL